MTASIRYPILRSGFITFDTKGFRRSNQPDNATTLALLGKTQLAPDNSGFYHENLHLLFAAMVRNLHGTFFNEFEVQEKILKGALEAFGTKNFFDWVSLQDQNPEFSSAHQRFLIETLEYIAGTPRKINVTQWLRILEKADSHDQANIRTNDYGSKVAQHRKMLGTSSLASVIVRWLRQDNGNYDFLSSMAVIFGNRRYSSGEAS